MNTVLVESNLDKLYYEEVNRQLGDLKIKLFPTSLRFVTFKPLYNSRSVSEFETISKDLENVAREIKTEYKNNISRFKQRVDSIVSTTSDVICKKVERFFTREMNYTVDQLDELTQYSEMITYLKELPSRYFENLQKFEGDDKLQLDYSALMMQFQPAPCLLEDSLKYFVQQSNQQFNFNDSNLERSYVFGILNRKDSIRLENKDFCIYTDRYGIENCVFDPVHLFFVLCLEKPDHELIRSIEEEFSELVQPRFTISELDGGAIDPKRFEAFLNFVIEKISDHLDDGFSEMRSIKFAQPDITLRYPDNFLTRKQSSCSKFLSECGLEEKFMDKDTLLPSCSLMLDYLIKNKCKLLIPQKFVDQFQLFELVLRHRPNDELIKTIYKGDNVIDFSFLDESSVILKPSNYLEEYLVRSGVYEYNNMTSLFLPGKTFYTPLHKLPNNHLLEVYNKLFKGRQVEEVVKSVTFEMIIGQIKLNDFSAQICYNILEHYKKLDGSRLDQASSDEEKNCIEFFNSILTRIFEDIVVVLDEYII